jgi:hypothetical protein
MRGSSLPRPIGLSILTAVPSGRTWRHVALARDSFWSVDPPRCGGLARSGRHHRSSLNSVRVWKEVTCSLPRLLWVKLARAAVGFGGAAYPSIPEIGRRPANYAECHNSTSGIAAERTFRDANIPMSHRLSDFLHFAMTALAAVILRPGRFVVTRAAPLAFEGAEAETLECGRRHGRPISKVLSVKRCGDDAVL